jgi:F-type H+-transporting ATPase subunit delta
MAQNRTIARPYAKAVFELAFQEQALLKWSDMLAVAASIARDKRVITLMKAPQFSALEGVALFLEVGKEVFTEEMKNFIHILGEFKRLNTLGDIAELYEEMRAESERVVTVSLTSAFPIEDAYRERFMQALKNKTGCDITLECTVDKRILGGAIIRAGDLVIDGSIRGRLAKLSDAVGIS